MQNYGCRKKVFASVGGMGMQNMVRLCEVNEEHGGRIESFKLRARNIYYKKLTLY